MRYAFPSALAVLTLAGMASAQQGPIIAPRQPQPTPATQATANIVAVPAYQPVPVVNTAAYVPAYTGYSPAGSYLSGKADVINATSNAAITHQQSRQMQLDYYNQSLKTRQAVLDQARYERANTMNSEDVRIQKQIDALRRARNEPPLNEIWAGESLNALYSDIKKAHTAGVRGPAVPLDQETLQRINLTSGVTNSGPAVFKNGPKFRWPVVLLNGKFEADRMFMEDAANRALTQAQAGPVDLGLVKDMRNNVESMQAKLKDIIKDVSPGEYMDGKKFLRELDDGCVALKSPNVTNYFTGKFLPKGATVADLADHMMKNGLQFAPAVSGDQPSYTALYKALLTYDTQLAQSVSR